MRLPDNFQFDVSEVEIFHRGDGGVLSRLPSSLTTAFDLLSGLPDDFMADGQSDPPPQIREDL